LKAPLQAQHVQLFCADLRAGNVLTAILMENTTGLTLEGGSVVFYDNEIFLGEASLVTMKPRDETLLAYAVELGIEVIAGTDVTKLPVKRVTVEKGEIKLYNDRRQRTIYNILNRPKKKMNIFLDHIFLDGWQLKPGGKELEPPVDITDRYYRFSFEVPAEEKFTYSVREMTSDVETFSIVDASLETIQYWLLSKKISDPIYKQMVVVKDLQKAANQIGVSIYEKETEIREAKDHQDRLRKNIEVLSKESQDQKKYINELGREEDKLNQLYNSIKVDRAKKKQLELDASRAANDISYRATLLEDDAEEAPAKKE